MVLLKLLDDRPQFGRPAGQRREGRVVLGGVMARQRRAERQAVRLELPRPPAASFEAGADVRAQPRQVRAQLPVDSDQLVSECGEPLVRVGRVLHDRRLYRLWRSVLTCAADAARRAAPLHRWRSPSRIVETPGSIAGTVPKTALSAQSGPLIGPGFRGVGSPPVGDTVALPLPTSDATHPARKAMVLATTTSGDRSQDIAVLCARRRRYRGLPSLRWPRAVNGTLVTVNPDAARSLRRACSGQVR